VRRQLEVEPALAAGDQHGVEPDRGLVERTPRGRETVYRAVVSETALVHASSGRAVDEILERYGAAAMRHFAERLADVDADLRRQLLRLAEAHRRAPEEEA